MRRQSQQGRRDQLSDGRYPALPLPLPQAWRALVALCIGFFMILLDQTIVAVATPAFQADPVSYTHLTLPTKA